MRWELKRATECDPPLFFQDKLLGRQVCIALLLFVTFLLYCRVPTFGFINFDDQFYINQRVRAGLSWFNITWAFSTMHGFYHPITWLSLMLDGSLFGNSSSGYHGTNLILHLVNVVLTFLIALKVLRSLTMASFAAALFAIHPVNVEAVCWVSERKGLLGYAFLAASFLAYMRYTEEPRKLNYIFACVLFLLSLASKPIGLLFPGVLLMYDWFTREQVSARKWSEWKLSVLDKIPFAALSFTWLLLTYIAENNAGAVALSEGITVAARIWSVPLALTEYLLKLLAPFPLELPQINPGITSEFQQAGAIGVMSLLSLLAYRSFRIFRDRSIIFGVAWFTLLMLPVCQLVKIGIQSRADRYLYPAQLGLLLIFIRLLSQLHSRIVRSLIILSLFCVYGVCTFQRISLWRDSQTLFSHVVFYSDTNYMARLSLALTHIDHRELEDARDQLKRAVAAAPTFYRLHLYLADVLVMLKEPRGAITTLENGLRSCPRSPPLHLKFADLVASEDNLSIADYRRAFRHARLILNAPDINKIDGLRVLAAASARLGKFQDAIDSIEEAILLLFKEGKETEANTLIGRRDYYYENLKKYESIGLH